ncbi:4-(cytidine 5'-diphospho)-2-C-methyl-D-erythritol kinase [Rapidithrix thailandica]|uniref:4-diphosphocytidyl-2-C-methyl-D-erythritol kinase n=1 Tax=Rapidithrix thailandica TaxID=413964 RepID=A0AAW9SAP5_9BACT
MIVFPNAKINLGLNIVEKRPDGYHNIESCFYPVGWSDVLEVIPSDTLKFTTSGIPIPGSKEGNLCLKAFELISKDFHLSPVRVHLHKVIPIGAGLGGGSSDGAWMIKVLNSLFDLGLSVDGMHYYAQKLGADCPFFIENKPVMTRGIGNVFEPVQCSLKGLYMLLIYPDIAISTAEAYQGVQPKTPEHPLLSLLEGERQIWKDKVHNQFETHLFKKYPLLPQIKNTLYEHGAIYASMTGSGSCVYGIFEKETSIDWDPAYKVFAERIKY